MPAYIILANQPDDLDNRLDEFFSDKNWEFWREGRLSDEARKGHPYGDEFRSWHTDKQYVMAKFWIRDSPEEIKLPGTSDLSPVKYALILEGRGGELLKLLGNVKRQELWMK